MRPFVSYGIWLLLYFAITEDSSLAKMCQRKISSVRYSLWVSIIAVRLLYFQSSAKQTLIGIKTPWLIAENGFDF